MSMVRRFKAKLGGLLVHKFVRTWMSSLDYQMLHYDRSVDPVFPEFAGPVIWAFWHEYIPCPLYLRPHSNGAMLVSRHRDAEWLSEAARYMGFATVRGSSQRGGDAALREMIRSKRELNLGITPDGPRGPRRRLASGCIYLSSRLEIPIVPFGVAYDRAWRLPTWDRFAVPKPFARVRVVVGPRINIPPNVNRDAVGYYRQRVEAVINKMCDEAESWVKSGEYRAGQIAGKSQATRPKPTAQRASSEQEPHILPLEQQPLRRSA